MSQSNRCVFVTFTLDETFLFLFLFSTSFAEYYFSILTSFQILFEINNYYFSSGVYPSTGGSLLRATSSESDRGVGGTYVPDNIYLEHNKFIYFSINNFYF